MIIFDLDTLADNTNRRHYIEDPLDCSYCYSAVKCGAVKEDYQCRYCKRFPLRWKYDLEAYNAACGDDVPIRPVIKTYMDNLLCGGLPTIWTTRCESTRTESEKWLWEYDLYFNELKMRLIGNTEPAHVLKEQWLDELSGNSGQVDFVFDADPDSIAMFRQHGIYVFDCRQV